jgi:hypothetical protein
MTNRGNSRELRQIGKSKLEGISKTESRPRRPADLSNKHTDAEITLDAGEFGNCYSELLDAAESKYPKGGIQMKTSLSATANLSVARMEADDACLQIRALAVRRHRSTRC